MTTIGWFIAVAGLCLLVFGLRMMLRGKKMRTVPFRRPSEIAQGGSSVADPKGMVSTEGEVELAAQPLLAPMSGRPCLGYKLVVERKWEEDVEKDGKIETNTGKEVLLSEYHGSSFRIVDEQGGLEVDASKLPEADFEKSHGSSIDVGMRIPGTLVFGQLQLNTPSFDTDKRTKGFVGTETIIEPKRQYALGQLQDGVLTTPAGLLTGSLTLSSKGRERLLSSTHRNMVLGYAFGGVFAVGGFGLGIFGPKAPPAAAAIAPPVAAIAAAPSAPGPICQKAVECCQALTRGKGADGCDAYATLTEDNCETGLRGLASAAARRGRRVRAACR